MDLNGSWNPPESWPESSPPLPGWERLPDGSWYNPHANEDSSSGTSLDEADASQQRPVPDTPIATIPSLDTLSGDHETTRSQPTNDSQAASDSSSAPRDKAAKPEKVTAKKTSVAPLQFAETEANYVEPSITIAQLQKKAILAALGAAILVLMIGGGIVILLATL